MITYKDIKTAINQKLKTMGIEINSKDVTEGFNRPSFFVEFLNNNRSSDENQIRKSLSIQIYYFPTDRYEYSIEVLDVQEDLERLFDLKLPVRGRLLNVDEIRTSLNDGVLNCSFDLEFYDGRESEHTVIDDLKNGEDFREEYPIEDMEELNSEKLKE